LFKAFIYSNDAKRKKILNISSWKITSWHQKIFILKSNEFVV